MDKFTTAIVLVVWNIVGAHAASFPVGNYLDVLIDCGVTGDSAENFNNQTWYPDSFFTDSGNTKQISSSQILNDLPQFMTTLRYFPQTGKNCYTLRLDYTQRFIFRAGFYYANYDGMSRPPVFDLWLGGQPWTTVKSSSDRPIFYEVMYQPQYENISVCLNGSGDGGQPFISSLEATYLDPFGNTPIYGLMKNGVAYHLVSRLNFGGYDKIVEPWSGRYDACEEQNNRYWTPQSMPGYRNLTFEAIYCTGTFYQNRLPNSVINTAISSQNASQSIYVPVNFPTATPQSVYIVLYFYQNLDVNGSRPRNATRNMDIYVDGIMKGNVKLEKWVSGEVVSIYPLTVQGTSNVTIAPTTNGPTLPPLLNAMEVLVATPLAEQISEGFMVLFSPIALALFHVLCFVFVF